MKNTIPALNRAQLKNVLQVTPPGSYGDCIDWKNIVVRPCQGEEKGTDLREVYIPFDLASDSFVDVDDVAAVFDSIARVWGRITPHRGLIKYKGKHCFYLCFVPNTSTG